MPARRVPPQEPLLFTTSSASILETAQRIIKQTRLLQDQIVNDVQRETATFANTVLPLSQRENQNTTIANVLTFYQEVSVSEELRNASRKAQNMLDDFAVESSMREDLSILITAVLGKNESLDPESRRYLDREHRSYIRNGLGLPSGSLRDHFRDIARRINKLSVDFRTNLNQEKGTILLTLHDLEGIPEDILSSLRECADEDGNGTELDLPLRSPLISSIMSYATNASTRERIYVANVNKCNQNISILKEILVLRDEMARLLGYKHYADFCLQDKMIKSVEVVDGFLLDLRSKLCPGGLEEVEKLKRLKRDDLRSRGREDEFGGYFYLWDVEFYQRLMVEKECVLDQQVLKEYFEIESTVSRMLDIFADLFGLEFVEISTEDMSWLAAGFSSGDDELLWHEDVKMFSVWDRDDNDEFLGYLYVDLYSRPGKFSHVANFTLNPGFTDFTTGQGQRRYPSAAMVCNFAKPISTKPSLLLHREVWTLFHELGHSIHDVVSKTTYSRFHGTATVQDLCEAPSQLLENWCWSRNPLKRLGRHYSHISSSYHSHWRAAHPGRDDSGSSGGHEVPPSTIPDSMIDSLLHAKRINSSLFYLHQLHVATFDLKIHSPSSHSEVLSLCTSSLWTTLQKEITHLSGLEVRDRHDKDKKDNELQWSHREATIPHLIGEYAAGYYAYLVSQVYSLDMYYEFFRDEPMNVEQGRKYRRMILEPGGREHEIVMLERYLGRKVSKKAFYQELGLE